jgi:hypothetical protein
MLGLFELEVNGHTLIKLGNANFFSKETPWVMFGLRAPNVSLPFFKRNSFGEWERMFAISFPTIFQVSKIEDISWEVHLRVLGFGFSFLWQYGY